MAEPATAQLATAELVDTRTLIADFLRHVPPASELGPKPEPVAELAPEPELADPRTLIADFMRDVPPTHEPDPRDLIRMLTAFGNNEQPPTGGAAEPPTGGGGAAGPVYSDRGRASCTQSRPRTSSSGEIESKWRPQLWPCPDNPWSGAMAAMLPKPLPTRVAVPREARALATQRMTRPASSPQGPRTIHSTMRTVASVRSLCGQEARPPMRTVASAPVLADPAPCRARRPRTSPNRSPITSVLQPRRPTGPH